MKEVPRVSPAIGKISCQLRVSWEPGPHPWLGTRCPAAVPGAGDTGTFLAPLPVLSREGTWRRVGPQWGLISCSKQGKKLAAFRSSHGPSARWPSLSPHVHQGESGACSPSPLWREAGRLN